jgi:hypothetical protein
LAEPGLRPNGQFLTSIGGTPVAAADPEPPTFDAWGMPIIPPIPPVIDDELGWTTKDDGPGEWEPIPVTRTTFLMVFVIAGYGLLRTIVCKTGIHRTRRRNLL